MEPISQDEDILALIEYIPADRLQHYVNKSIPDAPRLLICGDSYIYGFILPLIAESFSETLFISSGYTQQARVLTDVFMPDLVLYEIVERMFNHKSFVW
jgi:hypothetical protein